MIRFSCELDLFSWGGGGGGGGVEGFCSKLIDLNIDPDAMFSSRILNS